MKVPLIVNPIIDRYNNQFIQIWTNSYNKIIPAPFKPYFYSQYPMKFPFGNYDEKVVNKRLMSNLKDTQLWKYSFQNTRYVSQYREDDSIESDILFQDRIAIDDENFYLKFPNTDKLKILHFDIETDTTGMFPTPERNAIIGIGAKCGNRKGIFLSETYNDDEEILNKFFKFVKETDPDIFSHYNGNYFDIPYMNKRMELNNIPLNSWSRDGKKPSMFKNKLTLGGRLSFDIYNEVLRDQTIYGIKNHKMKTLAKWLKFKDIIEVETTNMRELVNTSELDSYLKSDILITEQLFNIYFRNVLALAEMNKIPLNMMIDASPSFIPTIIHGRHLNKKLGIVSDKSNMERHPEHIHHKRGAIVDTFRPGLYLNGIHKIDFASQYPNAVRTFNISPETTRIVRYEDYKGETPEYYKFDTSNSNKYIYTIPDAEFNKNVVIEVDMTRRGFLSEFMDKVLTDRFTLKNRMKELDKDSVEYGSLKVIQNALKVTANIQTGYTGQLHARYGELACYVLITGMARWYLQKSMNWIENE